MMLMARIPAGFGRVAAAFDEDAARVRLCESSGSEHSPEISDADLSDLVKSFMERNERGGEEEGGEEARGGDGGEEAPEELLEIEKCERSDSDEKEKLQRLFEGSVEDDDDRNVKEEIRREVEDAFGLVGEKSSPEFKRRLMSRLREKGFDAGLCKSKWEKNVRFPGGDYEYIDITIGSPSQRYIVEPCLAGEFDIARPTTHYASLLGIFPAIFVGKPEDLNKVVRVMCSAIKASMKCMDLHVAPWRRHGYMQAKWFGSYRRTTNEVSTKRTSSSSSSLSSEDVPARRSISIGFEARAVKVYNCRDDYGRRTEFRVGLLASELNSHF